jgi:hypothetical protein
MPSVTVRLTIEAGFLALGAVGAVLAGLEPILFVALVAGAALLVALVEGAHARAASRGSASNETPSEEPAAPIQVESVDAEPAPEPEPRNEPVVAVSERSARAILASAPPPVQEAHPRVTVPLPEPEREPDPEPEPEPEPASSGPLSEWNIWELQRLVRDRPDDDRHEEWTAMILSLRDFARADGTLPPEFDELVRDSFGELLAGARTEAAAAP